MFPSVISWTLVDRSVFIFSIWSLFSRTMLFPLYFSVVILVGCGGDCSELGAWSSLESSFHRFWKQGEHISNIPLTLKGPLAKTSSKRTITEVRLKELPDQEKKIPRWRCQIKLGQEVSSTTINNPFLCFSRLVPLQRHEVSTFRVCIVHSSSTIRKHPVLQNPALSSTSHLPLLATGLCCAGIFHGFKIQ